MQKDSTQTIRRHPDGSIDTAHYAKRARAERSRQAHAMAGAARRGIRQLRARAGIAQPRLA